MTPTRRLRPRSHPLGAIFVVLCVGLGACTESTDLTASRTRDDSGDEGELAMPRSAGLPTKNRVNNQSTTAHATSGTENPTTTTTDPQQAVKDQIASLAANPQTAEYARRLAAALAAATARATAGSTTTTVNPAATTTTSKAAAAAGNSNSSETTIPTATTSPKSTTTTTVPVGPLVLAVNLLTATAGSTPTFVLSQSHATPVFLSCGGVDWVNGKVDAVVTNAANDTPNAGSAQCGTIGPVQTMTWTMPSGATPGTHSWCVTAGSTTDGNWSNIQWSTVCALYTVE